MNRLFLRRHLTEFSSCEIVDPHKCLWSGACEFDAAMGLNYDCREGDDPCADWLQHERHVLSFLRDTVEASLRGKPAPTLMLDP